MPRSRNSTIAASMSPFVSCKARLQSIIPAPVRSRSSLTSVAEISAIVDLLGLCDGLGGLGSALVLRVLAREDRHRLALRVRLDRGAGLDDLEIALRRRRGRGSAVAVPLSLEVAGRHLLLACV